MQTIDGVTLVANDRVLLVNQTNSIENGLWLAQTGTWTRPTDFSAGTAAGQAYVLITSGNVDAGASYLCSTPTAIIGTDAIGFSLFSLPDTTTAANVGTGTGLVYQSKTGVTLNFRSLLAGTHVNIATNANDITFTTDATNTNTASTIVARDASGNFSAGTITATLSGNATTATIATNFSGSLSGDVTGTQGVTVVSSVDGQTAANVAAATVLANAATSANTASTIIKRTATGGFSAGTISVTDEVISNSLIITPFISSGILHNDASGNISSSLIVDADIDAAANIADTKLATISTAGKIANSATTAMSANTASAIVARDGSGNFSAGTITANLTGTASNNVLKAGDTMTGVLQLPAGTTVLPSLVFTGSTTTGLSSNASNLSFSTSAAERMKIASGGTISINAFGTAGVVHNDALGNLSTSLIVNADIDSSAAIADTKLATISTAGKVANSATTATNTNTINTIVARDASGNFSAGTISATLSGNATTATTATNFSGSLSGDVTGTQGATVVSSVSGQTAANVAAATALANAATSANTASTIVKRDVSGNFSAGTISVTDEVISNSLIITPFISLGILHNDASGNISSSLIVDADVNAAANIADTKLATISTAGKVANSATTATNANIASAIVARDGSGNFSAGTITASLTGSASNNVLKAGDTMTGTLQLPAGTTASPSLIFTGSTTTGLSTNSGDLSFSTAALERMKISAGGTVSIDAFGTAGVVHNDASGNLSSSLIVNADIDPAANIADTKLATISMAGKVANSATTATNVNTASTIVARDASGNFSAGTITANLTGNAATATTATNFSGSLSGDVTGTQGATVVSSVGGQTAANVAAATVLANAATSANTASTIVKRDVSGNFSAGTISVTDEVVSNTLTITPFSSTGVVHNNALGLLSSSLIVNGDITDATISNAKLATISSANNSGNIVVRDGSGNFATHMITLTGTVTNSTDAATKAYVDSATSTGLIAKTPAVVVSLSNEALSGYPTVDGVTFPSGTNRILLTGQTNPVENGLWIVAAGAWSRPTDFTTGATAGQAYVLILSGTIEAGSAWLCSTPTAIIDTDTINFSLFTLPDTTTGANVGAGTGLVFRNKTGSTLNFRSLIADTHIAVTNNTDDITIGTDATTTNTASTIVARDASGNFSAGTITASLSGNATTATTATNFSGSLSGDVTGTQGATIVSFVGGQTAATVAAATVLANAATGANTASTIVKRDAAGNFSAGAISVTDEVVSNTLTMTPFITAGVVHNNASGLLSTSLIVNADIDAAANIADTKLATISAAGKVANSATTATSANSSSAIVARDASGNFSADTITASLTGSASNNVLKSGDTMTGTLQLPAGTTALPSLIFTGSTTTGLSTNAGSLSFSTAALERMKISAGGTVSINAFGTAGIVHNDVSGNLSSSLIVDADVSASAGIADTKLATISTAGKVANSATTATNINTASTIVARDGSGNFSAGTITATLSGNATTATTATNFSGSLSGDVTGTQGATVVSSVGGQTAANVAAATVLANAATSANTASTIVKRDASGNFSVGTISVTDEVISNSLIITPFTSSGVLHNDASGNISSSLIVNGDIDAAANIDDTKLATISTAGKIANSATTATSANSSSAIVARDSSGNFSAGTITASLTGSASNNVLKTGDTMTGTLQLPAGTTASPSLVFTGSTTTGLSTNAGSLSFSTAALERMKISAGGTVSINAFGTAGVVHNDASGNLSSSLIVNADIDPAAAIADTKLATISTAGKVANSATTATSTNTASAIVARDASGNFSAGIITANVSGNATTATTATNFSGSLIGDVTGTQGATVVSSVGGQTAANVAAATVLANAATSANTASAIVKRTATGGFSAGAISVTDEVVSNSLTITPFITAGVVHNNASGLLSSSLIVDGDITSATISNAKLATISSTNTSGNIVVRDGSGNFATNMITLAGSTTNATDAATKAYVDSVISAGLVAKTPALVVSTSNVALTGLQTIDSVTLVVNDRVLLVNQTNSVENGLWLAQSSAWTRPTDFATGTAAGQAYVLITSGAVNAGSSYLCSTPTAIIDTNPITFSLFALPDTTTATNVGTGTGLVFKNKTGVTLNFRSILAGTHVSIVNNSDDVTLSTDATNTNTASTIVARDASGNFSAGTITASLSGNATTATTATNFSGSLSGDVTGTQGTTVVGSVGGQTAANVAAATVLANAATSANTVNTIVKRDTSGNFSAGAISITDEVISSSLTMTPFITAGVVHNNASGLLSSSLIVNADIDAAANIADTKLATISTAGKVANSATTATSANTASAIVARDTSGNFSAGTITASLTGAASLNILKAGDIMTGTLTMPAGTAAAPSIQFTGSTNTGLSSPSANALALSTNSAQRLGISSSGAVTINNLNSSGVVHNSAAGLLTTSLIVNADVDPAAAITDTKLATISTTGKVANSATTATNTNTVNTIVARDASGNFSAGTIAANLTGNATTATTATNFSGSLTGDVTGTQGATVVSSVGGQTAANVAAATVLANAATSANTASTIVKRNASGNFSAGAISVTDEVVSNTLTITPFITAGVVHNNASGLLSTSLIIDADIDAAANIADTKLATISTAGKVANSATTATSGNTASTIVARDSSGNFSAGTITASLTGSASNNVLKAGDTMTGTLQLPAGTTAAPSLVFTGSTATGLSTNAGSLSFSTAAAERMKISAGGTVSINAFGTAGVVHNDASGNLSSSLIVNADVDAAANIADTKLATISTAGKVANSATTATNINTASTIVARDVSGNFSAGIITANLTGNATTATTATNFSGSLSGDVTGTQGATVVSSVGGQTAANVAAATVLANTATSANTASTIVKRDASGNFSAGAISVTDEVVSSSLTITPFITAGVVHNNASGLLSSSLIVDADIDAAANIADTKLATISTAGKVANSATTATSTNTANAIVARDASGNFSAGTIIASLTGSASNNVLKAGDTMTGALQLPAGTAAAPSLVFTGSITTGLSSSTSNLSLSTSALERMKISAGGTISINAFTSAGIVHNDASGNLSSSLITNADIVTSAGIVDSKLATISTAGKVANSATTATSANSANAIVARDSSGNFSAGTITANLTGNVTGNVTGSASLNVLKAGDTMTGALTMPAGTTISPSIKFTGSNSGTGIAAATVDTLSFDIAGTEHMNISSSGITIDGFTNAGVVHNSSAGLLSTSLIVDADITAATITNDKLANISSSNVANDIVVRDASGNFSAGIITANVTGTVTGNVIGSASLNVLKAGDTMTGALQLPAGTTALPSLIFTGSATTGFSANTGSLSLSTNALERMKIASDGTISINAFTLAGIVHNDALGNLSSSLIINSDISTSAAITDNKLNTISTAGKVANSATTATSLNNTNTIVARDNLGNFSAGTITANLTGTASNNLPVSGGTITGTLTVPAGTIISPSIEFTGSSAGTGISAPTADTLSFDIAGTEHMNISSSGLTLDGFTAAGIVHNNSAGLLSTSLIVNADVDPAANIADTKLATISTTGKVANSATTATSANTTSAIVARDASGNFSAGTITASLNGTASNNVLKAGDIMTGSLQLPAGTTALPSLVFTGSTTTGLSANTGNLSFSTTAVERMKIASGGTISINAFTTPGIVHNDASGNLSSSLITNADIIASAGIVDTKLATISTAGKVANSATTATSANSVNAIVARDASGNFSAGTITASLTGNVTGNVTGSASLNVLKAGDTMTGMLTMPAGTAATPSIQFTGSTNTGLSAATTNTLSFDTNGVERMNINPTGGITINGLNTLGIVHNSAAGLLSTSLIINADVDPAANIADTKLATISTTGKVANSATTATSANTASAIVARDASGNFSAGTITASLNGTASSNVLKAGDTMTGALQLPAGTTALPSLVFTGSTTTGLSANTGNLSLSTNAVERMRIASGGTISINAFTSAGVIHNDTSGNLTSSLIVNADITAAAGIVDSKLATISTAGKVANSATTATSTNTASAIVARDTSGNFATNMITLNGTPTNATDAATKGYVDAQVGATGTSLNTPNTFVLRDNTGSFAAQVVSVVDTVASGNLVLSANPSTATIGNILKGGNRFIHNFGTSNTFIGENAGNFSMSGTGLNTAIGANALIANTTGNNNTVLGYNALSAVTTGSSNIAIGSGAGVTLTTGSGNIYINADAGSASEAATTRIGTSQTACYIQGIYGVGVSGSNMRVASNGKIGIQTSSKRFKHNIKDMKEEESADMYKLRPVTFAYNNDTTETIQYGLIAEEVNEVYPTMVDKDEKGTPYTVHYDMLPVLLLNEMKKQQVTIQELQNDNAQCKEIIQQLMDRITSLEAKA